MICVSATADLEQEEMFFSYSVLVFVKNDLRVCGLSTTVDWY